MRKTYRKSATGRGVFWEKLLLSPFASFVIALIVGAVVIACTGYSVSDAYGAMVTGAFGSIDNLIVTLSQATPVLFTALAYAFASKSGVINLGMEGQFLAGAMAATLAGIYLPSMPSWIAPVFPALAAILSGILVALIPAAIRRFLGGDDMLTSLLLNYVVTLFTEYLVNYPFRSPENIAPATISIQSYAEIPLLVEGTQLSYGLIIGIAIAVWMYYYLYKTVPGYEMRAIGQNSEAANFKGIQAKNISFKALLISGAIAALGGGLMVQSVYHNFIQGISPGYGWDGMSAALLGGCGPFGTILGSVVFGALRSGGIYMSRVTTLPADFISVIEGILLLFVAAPAIMRRLTEYLGNKKR